MPACRLACRSSGRAIAETPMIGTQARAASFASPLRASARIARVASRPFITGIETSISTQS